jgi:hypothetical protein
MSIFADHSRSSLGQPLGSSFLSELPYRCSPGLEIRSCRVYYLQVFLQASEGIEIGSIYAFALSESFVDERNNSFKAKIPLAFCYRRGRAFDQRTT